ncbi:hypothetical protein [Marininema mesophilum]|nr:hypothetical protein [Marininema mesophilum]
MLENTTVSKEENGDLPLSQFALTIEGERIELKETIEGTYVIRKGDRIAQGIITPALRSNFEEVQMLNGTEREQGGFGSWLGILATWSS